MPVVIHMPEPVLGHGKALGKERIMLGPGTDVRNPPLIANDVDRPLQAGKTHLRGHVWQGGFQVRFRNSLWHPDSVV